MVEALGGMEREACSRMMGEEKEKLIMMVFCCLPKGRGLGFSDE